MKRPEVENVLDAIYDAAADPQLWRRALEKVGDRFGGAPMVLGLQPIPKPAMFAVSARLDEDLLKLFVQRYSTPATNPSIPYYLSHPVAEPFDYMRLYGASRFQRTDLYKDLYESQKIWPRCAAALFKQPNLIAPFGMMGRANCETLTTGEIDELKFFFGHIARALRVTARILVQTSEQDMARLALNRLALAVVVVSSDGKVIFMNEAAEQIARTNDGLGVAASRLHAANPDERAELTRLIAAACGRQKRGGGSMGISRPSGAEVYGIDVTSLTGDSISGAAAAVFISDPTLRVRDLADQVTAVFGLTAAEARITVKLTEGVSVAEASEQLGISTNTMKTLLKRVFAKVGVRRQSELVRRVSSTIPNVR